MLDVDTSEFKLTKFHPNNFLKNIKALIQINPDMFQPEVFAYTFINNKHSKSPLTG